MTDAEAAAALEGAQERLQILGEWLVSYPDDVALQAERHDVLARVVWLAHWFQRN